MNRRFLTLLTPVMVLVLMALACSIRIPNTQPVPTATNTLFPTATNTLLTPTPNALGATATVRKPLVNVRKSPNGPVAATLKAGVTVTVLACNGSWCQIKDPAGWVWRGCLSDNPSNLGCEAK
jgi:hypothetical protein